jgi:hypothetical protein
MFYNFFSENRRTVNEIMSKNVVETKGPHMTLQYGGYALHAGLARLYACMHVHMYLGTHMHRPICNTYCFSTVTVVL